MAARVSTGSPRASRKPTPATKFLDDTCDTSRTPRVQIKKPTNAMPLQTNSFANLQPAPISTKTTPEGLDFDDMLVRLRMNDMRKPDGKEHENSNRNQHYKQDSDEPMAKANDRVKPSKHSEPVMNSESDFSSAFEAEKPYSCGVYTPHTESCDEVNSKSGSEMDRVKQELEAARSVINKQQQELDQTRSFQHTMDQALGTPSEPDYSAFDGTIGGTQSAFNVSANPFTLRANPWLQTDNQHDFSSKASFGNADRSRIDHFGALPSTHRSSNAYGHTRDNRLHLPDYAAIYADQRSPLSPEFLSHRVFSNNSSSFAFGSGATFSGDNVQANTRGQGRNMDHFRSDTSITGLSSQGELQSPIGTFISPSLPQVAPIPIPTNSQQYLQARAMSAAGSPFGDLSFGTHHGLGPGYVGAGQGQTYVTPLEPMNYRRLLDKSVSCDWKYIVDKIVCNNDQQASIFLQQKLKVGTAEQKFEIVESIINQAYPLMINRFGNFLVQRCFEHGTPDQVIAIANAIHGNVTSLSMDPFGCHVVQKAFDSVPENHKADMVRELLRRIPDTVIHRYACHVWQKLFELRWSGEPPQIMIRVNEALRGMWHEVALGETGSLVVQNIFENCIEEEKRPAIEEVISNIDLIAHGQFGNWCIQHLCEHGSPPDKRRVIDHILKNAYNYSIDQYASKVIEKCLKIGGLDFLDRYLEVITTSHPDRPRIPLIDIAGDQYGNYLIQWILMNTHQHQREQVAIHIRKHMVSLRGSKFGSRVAMLCCNPASVTRPGPGALVNPYGAPGQPRTQWNRLR